MQSGQSGPDLAGFVTGRILARTALARLAGISPEEVLLRTACPDCGGPHGKPQIVGAAEGWELSIAHSGGVVAVALALGSPVGIGVQRPRPRGGAGRPPEHELLLTPVERAEMERLSQARRVRAGLAYRARKEAVLKAIGESLHTPLSDFAVSRPDRPPALLGWYPPDGGRPVPAIADVPLADRHQAAVAVLGVRSVLPTVHDGRDLLPGGRPARWRRRPRGRPGSPADRTR
jgi:4'-phosphopantetheinyl transferase